MQAWENFLKHQNTEIGQDTVQKWLKPLKILHYDAQNLHLEAKDSFQALWFEEHIRPKTKSLTNNNNRPIKIHLTIANQQSSEVKRSKESPKQIVPPFKIEFEELSPNCTFDQFSVHEGNLLVHKLLCKITGYDSETNKLIPGVTELGSFNPVFLHGPSGTGKTHLLMAVAQTLKDRAMNVRYIRSEKFTEHVVAAIRAGEMSAFRQAYRTIDVLIIDDVHIFSRKRATQEEFFHSFNALHLSGKQIIISANCLPAELAQVEPRLISRFEWGIVLPLEPPNVESAKKIILKKAHALKFPVSPKVIEFLVTTFLSSLKALCRALEALILRIHLQDNSVYSNHPENIPLPLVKHLLADLVREEERYVITSDKILQTVAHHFDIEVEEITGTAQSRDCVLPRQIAMYLCRTKLNISYTKIGDLFDRDHSTVMTSVKRIQKDLDEDNKDLLTHLHTITKNLQNE